MSETSRLYPANPSLSPQQPTGSILLNAPARDRANSSATSRGFSPARSISALSINSSASPCVSFAPLPQVPPELKRRSSITLGVAARSNLLKSQGSAAPNYANGQRLKQDVKTVMMTDDQWEQYKKQYEGEDPPDLGELAMKTGKKLWRKARGSFSSTNSSSSTSSTSGGQPVTTPKLGDRRISETTTLPTIDSAPSSPTTLKRTVSSPMEVEDTNPQADNVLGLTAEERDHELFNEARKQKETKGEFGLVRAAEVDLDDDEEDENENENEDGKEKEKEEEDVDVDEERSRHMSM